MVFSTTAALFKEITDSPVKPPVTKAIFFFMGKNLHCEIAYFLFTLQRFRIPGPFYIFRPFESPDLYPKIKKYE